MTGTWGASRFDSVLKEQRTNRDGRSWEQGSYKSTHGSQWESVEHELRRAILGLLLRKSRSHQWGRGRGRGKRGERGTPVSQPREDRSHYLDEWTQNGVQLATR